MFAVGLGLGAIRADAAEPPADIDARPALTFEGWQVSHYLIAKYFGRFVEEIRSTRRREPTTAERAAWLAQFETRQAMVALARQDGYDRRPVVVDVVTRMERHMLTQLNGPYYAQAAGVKEVPELDLRADYADAVKLWDLRIARFHDEPAVNAALGAGFGLLRRSEQDRRIDALIRDGAAEERIDGVRGWPFLPFPELVDDIRRAPIDQWVVRHDPVMGWYAWLVRSVRDQEAPPFDQQRAGFVQFEKQVQLLAFQRRHRRAIFLEDDFAADDGALRELAAAIAAAPGPEGTIDLAHLAFDPGRPVGHCRRDGQTVPLTAGGLVAYCNGRFVRAPVADAATLRSALEDWVVAEVDEPAARAAGVDRTPQFVEDRHGFLGIQILDAYERDRLAPGLAPTPAAIDAYRRGHAGEFSRPVKIRLRLLRFDDAEAAGRWIKRGAGRSGSAAEDDVREDRTVVVALEQPLPGLEAYQRIFFGSPDGVPIGPLPAGGTGVQVAVKEGVEASEAMPAAETESSIRAILLRASLDRRERELAREWASHTRVDDDVDYVSCGVTAEEVERPWR